MKSKPDMAAVLFAATTNKPAAVAADETPQYTALQEFKRRRWTMILCTGAMNETSLKMARRLCHEWFKDCQCDCRRGQDN